MDDGLGRGTTAAGAEQGAEAGFGSRASEAILTAAADGIVAVDDKGIIRICIPAAEELYARPARELLGTPFGHPVVAGGATEIDLVLPGGQRNVVEMRVTTTTVEGERLHVVALRDITRRRQLEQELQSALEHQNVVVAVAAHELGNPLAAISVLVYALRDPHSGLTGEKRAEIIDRIAERTAYLQALVHKLLVASRIETKATQSQPARVPVLELTLERVAELDEQASHVQVSCSPDLAVLADRGELSEMLVNYLENAIAYGRPPIEVVADEKDGQVEIRVCDRGPGVPNAFVPRLFDRFTRDAGVEQETEGTGLGLWIVRNLAQANGGTAWYEPNKAGGACFCLRLQQDPAVRRQHLGRHS